MTRLELEELRNQRAQLEEATRSLKKKQKKLEDNVLILEERVIIDELDSQQKQLQQKVSILEKQKNSLESKLQSESVKTPKPPKKIKTKKQTPNSKKKVTSIKEAESEENDGVTITAVVDRPVEKQKTVNKSKKQVAKKKRFFF